MARPKKNQDNIFDSLDPSMNPDDKILRDLGKDEIKELNVADIAAVMLDEDDRDEIQSGNIEDFKMEDEFICALCHMSCHSALFDHKDKKGRGVCSNCS